MVKWLMWKHMLTKHFPTFGIDRYRTQLCIWKEKLFSNSRTRNFWPIDYVENVSYFPRKISFFGEIFWPCQKYTSSLPPGVVYEISGRAKKSFNHCCSFSDNTFFFLPAAFWPNFTLNFEAKLFITSDFLLGLWGRDFSTFFIVLDLIELLNGECNDVMMLLLDQVLLSLGFY